MPCAMLGNIFWLGTKELRSFLHDYRAARAGRLRLLAGDRQRRRAAIRRSCTTPRSPSSTRTIRRCRAASCTRSCRRCSSRRSPSRSRDIVPLMNAGHYTFVVDIPPHFERDVLAGRSPALQIDVDATAMVQAGLGSGYAAADHRHRDRATFSPTPRASRRRRSTSSCASPSTPTSPPRGSPASWASSTMSPCSPSSCRGRPSCASASTARWIICSPCR